jgi:hypothetical protein
VAYYGSYIVHCETSSKVLVVPDDKYESNNNSSHRFLIESF